MDKKEILTKLEGMSASEIDKLKDEKLVEYRNILHDYHKAKDDEMVARHEKRKELLNENSHSKTEQLLRADEELFQLRRKVSGLSDLKEQLRLAIEILTNYYWKNRT